MYFKGTSDRKIVSNSLINEWQFGVKHFQSTICTDIFYGVLIKIRKEFKLIRRWMKWDKFIKTVKIKYSFSICLSFSITYISF